MAQNPRSLATQLATVISPHAEKIAEKERLQKKNYSDNNTLNVKIETLKKEKDFIEAKIEEAAHEIAKNEQNNTELDEKMVEERTQMSTRVINCIKDILEQDPLIQLGPTLKSMTGEIAFETFKNIATAKASEEEKKLIDMISQENFLAALNKKE